MKDVIFYSRYLEYFIMYLQILMKTLQNCRLNFAICLVIYFIILRKGTYVILEVPIFLTFDKLQPGNENERASHTYSKCI